MLLLLIRTELKHLYETDRQQKAVADEAGVIETVAVSTSLSVSQLGVFLRLLITLKIIETNNINGLIKRLCSCITTKKTQQVSAGSLRAKYYQVETPAKNIVKEYLFRMVKAIAEL